MNLIWTSMVGQLTRNPIRGKGVVVEEPDFKVCSTCDAEQPKEAFNLKGDGTRTRKAMCKTCTKAYLKTYRLRDKLKQPRK